MSFFPLFSFLLPFFLCTLPAQSRPRSAGHAATGASLLQTGRMAPFWRLVGQGPVTRGRAVTDGLADSSLRCGRSWTRSWMRARENAAPVRQTRMAAARPRGPDGPPRPRALRVAMTAFLVCLAAHALSADKKVGHTDVVQSLGWTGDTLAA